MKQHFMDIFTRNIPDKMDIMFDSFINYRISDCFDSFFESIIDLVKIRPFTKKYIYKLLFIANDKLQMPISKFTDFLLNTTMESKSGIEDNLASIHIIYCLYYENIYDISEIWDIITDIDNVQQIPFYLLFLFLSDQFFHLKAHFPSILQIIEKMKNIPEPLLFFHSNKITLLPKINEIIDYGWEKSSLGYIIKYDDIQSLREHFQNPDFNPEKRLPLSFGETCPYIQRSTLLQYSAYCCSINCFKSLLLITPNPITLPLYAIAGGNYDIIRISCTDQRENHYFLKLARQFQRPELLEWFIQKSA